MDKSKKFRMPAGIRNKLTAAIAMLLVSSIMMVSSTYAWFTLSTAPEVTGITTSVGANGNLEMALLNTDTFVDLDSIASAVGNSSANATTTVQQANVTWGNLVDLSDVSYGLHLINLQPARLNFKSTTANQVTTYDMTALNSVLNLLQIAEYGKDGRVSELSDETYSTIYAEGGWVFDDTLQQYGVRAIGSNDNLSPQQAGLIAAKAAYTSNLKSAQSAVQGALSANGNAMASALTTLAMGSSAGLTDEQTAAISAMIYATDSALNYIDAAYKQVLLGLASAVEDATAYANAAKAINEALSYDEALTALGQLTDGVTIDAPTTLTNAVNNLKTQKQAVADARTAFGSQQYTTALGKLVDSSKVTINGYKSDQIKNEDGSINSDFTNAVIKNAGANVEMPDGSGVFAYVGSVAGNYSASCLVDIKISDTQTLSDLPATMQTTATVDPGVGTTLNQVQAAAGAGGTTVLSDTYGYALDFAFRTNAAESYLQLQTAGVQRVYSDSTSAATQGAGSSMTFQVTKTDAGAPTLTNEQVINLMQAIRVAFVDPTEDSGKVYGIAALTDIVETADGFKGDLYLHNYSIFQSTGVLTLDGKRTTGFEEGATENAIMKLDQSVAARLTVVVWLDGDMVDNADVANAAQSLVGAMNLQFSSSAELIPMQNTALENLTITYTEIDDPNYKAGLYTFNGNEYVLKDGYKIYNGSDNTVYFSNDESTYTKLTVMNYSTAMAPLTASVTGVASIEKNGTTTLTAKASHGTITSVVWTVADDDTGIVTVAADESTTDATVVLTGKAKGTAEITAKITIEIGGADVTPVTREVEVKFNVSVAPEVYDVNAPEGVTGAITATEGLDYTFTVAEGYTLDAVTVDGVAVEPTKAGNTYTIAGASVTGDIVITATATVTEPEEEEGEDTYTVTFYMNNGDENQYTTEQVATMDDAPAAEREGYAFLGWSATQTAATPDENITLSEGLKLYAVWAQTYTVTIDENITGGTVTANVESAKAGDTVTLTATPDDDSYVVTWTVTGPEGAVTVTDNAFTMPAGGVTVTATFASAS